MWQWTLTWSRLREDIVIGSCPMTTADIDAIAGQAGVTALLSLQSEACRQHFAVDYDEHRTHGVGSNLAMVNAPMLDFDDEDQRRQLPEAVRSLQDLLAAGHRVYLYCTDGINRSPLVALGYLTFVEMLSCEEAIEMILAVRPEADPSWAAYHRCREELVERMRPSIMVRAYYLSQVDPEQDPQSNWIVAEAQALREAFLNGGLLSRARLDPARAA